MNSDGRISDATDDDKDKGKGKDKGKDKGKGMKVGHIDLMVTFREVGQYHRLIQSESMID